MGKKAHFLFLDHHAVEMSHRLDDRSPCENCKHRKVKCGRELPSCDRCIKSGLLCSFVTGMHDDKRLRSRVACQQCRFGKRKCSGDLPKCKRCLKRKEECIYVKNTSFLGSVNVEELYEKIDAAMFRPIVYELCKKAFQKDLHFFTGNFIDTEEFMSRLKTNSVPRMLLRAVVGMALDSVEIDSKLDLWWLKKNISDMIMPIKDISIDFFVAYSITVNCLFGREHDNMLFFYLLPLLCRLAFILLLHYEKREYSNPKDAEYRRRMLWNCFWLDKNVSAGLPEFVSCDISLIETRLPSDIIGQEGNYVDMESGPNGVLSLSVYVSQLRYLALKTSKKAVRACELWWEEGSDFRQTESQMLRFVQNLPPYLEYCEENIVAQPTLSLSRLFIESHMWLNQIFCDLYRVSIPGIPESTPEIIAKLMSQEVLAHYQSECILHSINVCKILRDNSEMMGRSPNNHLIPTLYESCRILLCCIQYDLQLEFPIDINEIGSLVSSNISILLHHDAFRSFKPAQIAVQYLTSVITNLGLSRYVPVASQVDTTQLIKAQAMARAQNNKNNDMPIRSEQLMLSKLHPAVDPLVAFSFKCYKKRSHTQVTDMEIPEASLEFSYELLLSTFMVPWPEAGIESNNI